MSTHNICFHGEIRKSISTSDKKSAGSYVIIFAANSPDRLSPNFLGKKKKKYFKMFSANI